jgi:hypothetical protein
MQPLRRNALVVVAAFLSPRRAPECWQRTSPAKALGEGEQKYTMTKTIIALFVAATTAISSHALTILSLADTRIIGQVSPGTSTSAEDNAAYINSLVDRSYGLATSSFDIAGQSYALFNNQGGTLTYATAVGIDTGGVGGDHIVGGVTGFEFLLVKYAGANGEAYIYNVAGLTGEVQVPATDPQKNTHNKYLLFNTAATQRVPEGGNAAILLGISLAVMGLFYRKTRVQA